MSVRTFRQRTGSDSSSAIIVVDAAPSASRRARCSICSQDIVANSDTEAPLFGLDFSDSIVELDVSTSFFLSDLPVHVAVRPHQAVLVAH